MCEQNGHVNNIVGNIQSCHPYQTKCVNGTDERQRKIFVFVSKTSQKGRTFEVLFKSPSFQASSFLVSSQDRLSSPSDPPFPIPPPPTGLASTSQDGLLMTFLSSAAKPLTDCVGNGKRARKRRRTTDRGTRPRAREAGEEFSAGLPTRQCTSSLFSRALALALGLPFHPPSVTHHLFPFQVSALIVELSY